MAKLAIHGGPPAIPGGLTQAPWPVIDQAERQGLLEVLEGGQWCLPAEGKVVQFQQEFARYIGTRHATACHTGTDALELAFRSCDIDSGDEVIVPAVTFLASASAVVLAMDNRFMMDGESVDRIVGAIGKLRDHLDELGRVPQG